jgi:hypothetical protein
MILITKALAEQLLANGRATARGDSETPMIIRAEVGHASIVDFLEAD